jgi:hypothetical protein
MESFQKNITQLFTKGGVSTVARDWTILLTIFVVCTLVVIVLSGEVYVNTNAGATLVPGRGDSTETRPLDRASLEEALSLLEMQQARHSLLQETAPTIGTP